MSLNLPYLIIYLFLYYSFSNYYVFMTIESPTAKHCQVIDFDFLKNINK